MTPQRAFVLAVMVAAGAMVGLLLLEVLAAFVNGFVGGLANG